MIVQDVIVIGLGAHGSSSAAHLAQSCIKVLGFEKFGQVHTNGSSHGRSRIIRQAYFEDPRYVPLLKRSFALWRNLEKEYSQHLANTSNKEQNNDDFALLKMTGGLMIGSPQSDVIKGTLASVKTHALPHQVLTADEIKAKFKVFQPSNDEIGVLEEEAGYLIPERCILAYQALATKFGAELHFNESMVNYCHTKDSSNNDVIEVYTSKGRKYYAKKLVLSVGAWAPEIYGNSLPKELGLHVERRVLYWLEPRIGTKELFQNIPVYIWDVGSHQNFYGFPCHDCYSKDVIDNSVKIAVHQSVFPPSLLSIDSCSETELQTTPTMCSPDNINRNIKKNEISNLLAIIRTKLPDLLLRNDETNEDNRLVENSVSNKYGSSSTCTTFSGVDSHLETDYNLVHATTCLYTLTNDEHFVIDWEPDSENTILLVSACSGHGFKFTSVIGEIVADLIVKNETNHDITLFMLSKR